MAISHLTVAVVGTFLDETLASFVSPGANGNLSVSGLRRLRAEPKVGERFLLAVFLVSRVSRTSSTPSFLLQADKLNFDFLADGLLFPPFFPETLLLEAAGCKKKIGVTNS